MNFHNNQLLQKTLKYKKNTEDNTDKTKTSQQQRWKGFLICKLTLHLRYLVVLVIKYMKLIKSQKHSVSTNILPVIILSMGYIHNYLHMEFHRCICEKTICTGWYTCILSMVYSYPSAEHLNNKYSAEILDNLQTCELR